MLIHRVERKNSRTFPYIDKNCWRWIFNLLCIFCFSVLAYFVEYVNCILNTELHKILLFAENYFFTMDGYCWNLVLKCIMSFFLSLPRFFYLIKQKSFRKEFRKCWKVLHNPCLRHDLSFFVYFFLSCFDELGWIL